MATQPDSSTCAPLVSVVIVNTNELHYLERCLPSVHRSTYPNFEVLIVDNQSQDGSVEYVREHFPDMRVIHSPANLGYPGANNLGFEAARGEYLTVLNPDTEVEPAWLDELVAALVAHPEAGLATSKILLMDDPTRINACGNVVSVAGLTFCRGVGEPATAYDRQEEVLAVSGAAFLIRRTTLEAIGPFDPRFMAYLEETDLSLRARLAGVRSLYVPTSRVYHRYSFRLGEWKTFHIEKNRHYMLLKLFERRTLLLLAPALLYAELLVWGYMLLKGRRFVYQKWLSYQWLWRHRAIIRANRTQVQQLRQVSDRELLERCVPQLHFHQMVQHKVASVLDALTTPVLTGWSHLVLRFVG
jgi:GT2 family glycosyltransferase